LQCRQSNHQHSFFFMHSVHVTSGR
jgi:hypothetical protein